MSFLLLTTSSRSRNAMPRRSVPTMTPLWPRIIARTARNPSRDASPRARVVGVAALGADHDPALAAHHRAHGVEPEARGEHAVARGGRAAALGMAEDHAADLVAGDLLHDPLQLAGAAGVRALGHDDDRGRLAAPL